MHIVKQTKRKHNVYIDMLKERRNGCLDTFPKAFLTPKPRYLNTQFCWISEEKLGLRF